MATSDASAHRGLAGEHEGGRAVEHGVCDIGRLGAGRLRLVDHRLEHLRRRDHGPAGIAAGADDELLDEGDVGGADLDPQVAARHHHRIADGDDVVEVLDRLGLLDLGDDPRVRPARVDPLAQLLDVGGRAHERERDVVGADPEREVEVGLILVGQGWDRQVRAGQVHALAGRDQPAHLDPCDHARTLHRRDPRPHHAVVDQHLAAGRDGLGDTRVGHVQIAGGTLAGRGEDERVAGAHRARLADPPDADLRPLQVGDHGERAADQGLGAAHRGERLAVHLVVAVGEVQPGGVHARPRELLDRVRIGRCRPDRAHDLGPARPGVGHRAGDDAAARAANAARPG